MVGFGHIGWETCGDGLTCRPRQTADEVFLDDLLHLSGYPGRSVAALLAGTLKLKYCSSVVSRNRPTWGLGQPGRVVDLLTVGGEDVGLVAVDPVGSCLMIHGFRVLEVYGRESDSQRKPLLLSDRQLGEPSPCGHKRVLPDDHWVRESRVR